MESGGSFDGDIVKNIEKSLEGAFVEELILEVCVVVILDPKFEEPLEDEEGRWRILFVGPPRVSSFSVFVPLCLILLLLIIEHIPNVDPQIWR